MFTWVWLAQAENTGEAKDSENSNKRMLLILVHSIQYKYFVFFCSLSVFSVNKSYLMHKQIRKPLNLKIFEYDIVENI